MKATWASIRKNTGRVLFDTFFEAAGRSASWLPPSWPSRHGVEVVRNLRYREAQDRAYRLDVYRPAEGSGPWPVVLYLHGGSFRICSKDTHWVMALAYARRGFVVVNVNYRLAPKWPFPAAVEDAAAAFVWTCQNARRFGGDLSKLVVAGESAGANLGLGLTTSCCFERPEPWAKAVWQEERVPVLSVLKCGLLQTSNPMRFQDSTNVWSQDRITEIAEAYLGSADAKPQPAAYADPLVFFESRPKPERPLPTFHLSVGTADPIREDTRRAVRALEAIDARVVHREYEGEPHAFQAFVWRAQSRAYWRDHYAFLDELFGRAPTTPDNEPGAALDPSPAQ